MPVLSCEAIRYNDEMQCARCGLTWDVKDPDPPECRTAREVALADIRSQIKLADLRSSPYA